MDQDVKDGLAKRALCATCSNGACNRREGGEGRFKQCSRCLVAKFCSAECAAEAWPAHKAARKAAAAVAAEQTSDKYRAEQRRLKDAEKVIQRRLAAAAEKKATASPPEGR